MELILIRHGRPEQIENADGPADPPLTDIGHRQAQAVAAWMAAEPIDAIYVSPMARARQTSDPLERVLGLEATVVPGVREYDADHASYVPMEVLKQNKAKWQAWLKAEKTTDRTEWSSAVIESIESLIAAHRGHRIAVVCHGGIINVWAAHLLSLGSQMFFNPDYTSVNRFAAASSGERSILSLNETAHLRGAPDLRLG